MQEIEQHPTEVIACSEAALPVAEKMASAIGKSDLLPIVFGAYNGFCGNCSQTAFTLHYDLRRQGIDNEIAVTANTPVGLHAVVLVEGFVVDASKGTVTVAEGTTFSSIHRGAFEDVIGLCRLFPDDAESRSYVALVRNDAGLPQDEWMAAIRAENYDVRPSKRGGVIARLKDGYTPQWHQAYVETTDCSQQEVGVCNDGEGLDLLDKAVIAVL
jgi:hypothetical protein